jgi:biopolymer transport protein TolR
MASSIQSVERGRRSRRRRPLAEINVTPFVDVMLVLLIVFMVTAPLLAVGIPVDTPKTQGQPLSENREPLTVTIKRDGTIYLQNTQVADDELVAKLTAIAENGYNERVFVRGDTAVDYGRVMQVMGSLNAAGFTRIGLVTSPPKPKPHEK